MSKVFCATERDEAASEVESEKSRRIFHARAQNYKHTTRTYNAHDSQNTLTMPSLTYLQGLRHQCYNVATINARRLSWIANPKQFHCHFCATQKKHERKRVNNFSEKCEVIFSKKETLKFQILDRGGATKAGFESSAEFRGNVFGPNSRHFSTRVRL